jgi:hypothetical protein
MQHQEMLASVTEQKQLDGILQVLYGQFNHESCRNK